MHHLSDAWSRREDPKVVLVHYDDLSADLGAEMRRLAGRLDIEIAEKDWPLLVEAATFEEMRSRPDDLVPDPSGVLKDHAMFFRRGTSGAGREILTEEEYAGYEARVAGLAPPDLLSWLHRG
jgi:aryl sulfotransferase